MFRSATPPVSPAAMSILGNMNDPYLFGDDDFAFLMKMANELRSRQFFVTFEGGAIYSSSYIGQMVAYFNTTLSELATGQQSMNTTKWLKGDLPVIANPNVEIGPDKILGYIQKTIDADPLGKLQSFRPRFDQLMTELATGQFKGMFREAM